MKIPLLYFVDNYPISKFNIEIRIRQSKRPCKIVSFENGISVLDMLGSNCEHDRGLPQIMIANLDLPGMDEPSFLRIAEEGYEAQRCENVRQNIQMHVYQLYMIGIYTFN